MEGGGGGTMAVALQSGRGGAMISFSAFRCLIPKRFFFIKPSSSSSSSSPLPPAFHFLLLLAGLMEVEIGAI